MCQHTQHLQAHQKSSVTLAIQQTQYRHTTVQLLQTLILKHQLYYHVGLTISQENVEKTYNSHNKSF